MKRVRLSRRQFLCHTSAAAALAVPVAAAAQAGSPSVALPPAIAALTSMRGQATPITADERRGRLERARALMAESQLGAIVLTGSTSLTYFTGLRWGNSERLMALIVPQRGEPFVVLPAFEEDRLHEQMAGGPLASARLFTWQEDESPYALVAQALRDRGLATGRIGVEETMRFVFSDGLASAAPALSFTSGTPVIAGCRMVKDAHELALMTVACQATLRCYDAVYRSLAPGMPASAVSGLVNAAYGRLGFPGFASVQVGEFTALPHGSSTPQTITDGTVVMMDDGCVAEGYQSDLTRTFVVGRATDRMRRVFDVVKRAQAAALAAARPGVGLGAVDAAARKVVADAGFGPGYAYFTHRLGDGIGMDMHEWPYLVPNNMFGWDRTLTARPGMTFSDEPGVYIRGEFGIRLEDILVITPDGARLLTEPSPSLDQPFG